MHTHINCSIDTGPRCSGTGQTICSESRGSAAGRMSERIDPKNPSETELARELGMVRSTNGSELRRRGRRRGTRWPLDRGLCRIGGSLGDRLRPRASGGQAGASARIENYLGFPTGTPGQALTARAYVQAQKFGSRMVIPTEVMRLDLTETPVALQLGDGRSVKA